MDKIVSVLLVALFVVSLAGHAWARDETRISRGAYYISGGTAATTPLDILFTSAVASTIVDVDFSLGDARENTLALGFALQDGKMGLEYAAISLGDGGRGEFSVSSIMIDGCYEKLLLGSLYYYLGAGIGAVTVSHDHLGEKNEIQRLAYKFRGGFLMDLGKSLSIHVGYSYLWGGDFDLETSQGTWSGNFISHGATAAVSFYF